MEEERKRELGEKYTYLQILLENLLRQREALVKNLEEIEETLEAIKNLKSDMEILFSVGGNVFGFGKLLSERFLVNVGSNIGIEVNKEKASEILKRSKETLIKNLNEIEKNINKIVSEQQKILNILQNKK